MKHLFLLFGFLLAAFTAQAATITQEGVTPDDGAGLYYNLYDDGTAEIVRNPDYSVYSMESLAIPATVTYNGVTYRVTTIGNNAFFNSTIKSISGGGNITKIGLCAFYVCKTSNPQPIGFRGNLLVKRQKFFYCTYSLGITETS